MDLVALVFRVFMALLGVDAGAPTLALDILDRREAEVLRTIVLVAAGEGRFECVPELPDERAPERMPCEDLRIARGSPLRR